jgi:hypothetical protein
MLPLASISMLRTSLSKESSDKQMMTLYPFSFATCSIPLMTVEKKMMNNFGIIILLFLFSVLLNQGNIVGSVIIKFQMPELFSLNLPISELFLSDFETLRWKRQVLCDLFERYFPFIIVVLIKIYS